MIAVNVLAVKTSAELGLAAAVAALAAAAYIFFKLQTAPGKKVFSKIDITELPRQITATAKPFIFFCLFIFVITINSGLMYRAVYERFRDPDRQHCR